MIATRYALLALVLFTGCIDGGTSAQDAPVEIDAQPEPVSPCCALLPDQDAVRACVPPLPPNTCGVLACPNDGGGFTRINICGPTTGGAP